MSSQNQNNMVMEFSLSLNNRTGKYFIGLDLLRGGAEFFDKRIRFWRFGSKVVPGGVFARILGRLMTWEVVCRTKSSAFDRFVPRMRPDRGVLFTDPLQCLLYKLSNKDVVICHDMGPITHPEYYASGVEGFYKKIFAEIVTARPSIVFVSEASRIEFERLYGSEYNSACVIAPAVRVGAVEGVLQAPVGATAPFFLTVGAVGNRKNQAGAIKAFEALGLAERGFQYVICGGGEPGAEAVGELAEATKGVLQIGYVSDAELRWLYANAVGFVLPSFLEGFGMPAAEAVARGLIPLITEWGALAEVTGASAVLVNPNCQKDLERGFTELISMPSEEKQKRLHDLRKSIDRFSPERISEAWRNALSSLVRTGRVA